VYLGCGKTGKLQKIYDHKTTRQTVGMLEARRLLTESIYQNGSLVSEMAADPAQGAVQLLVLYIRELTSRRQ
jgi:hypothetical protein